MRVPMTRQAVTACTWHLVLESASLILAVVLEMNMRSESNYVVQRTLIIDVNKRAVLPVLPSCYGQGTQSPISTLVQPLRPPDVECQIIVDAVKNHFNPETYVRCLFQAESTWRQNGARQLGMLRNFVNCRKLWVQQKSVSTLHRAVRQFGFWNCWRGSSTASTGWKKFDLRGCVWFGCYGRSCS